MDITNKSMRKKNSTKQKWKRGKKAEGNRVCSNTKARILWILKDFG